MMINHDGGDGGNGDLVYSI